MVKVKAKVSEAVKKDGSITEILGVRVFSTTSEEVLSVVTDWVESSKGKKLIFTPNSEIIVAGVEDEDFKAVLNRADLNIPDGMGIVLASRLLSALRPGKVVQKISTRVTGTQMVEAMVKLAALKGWRVYLLGGEGDEAEAFKEEIVTKYQQAKKGFRVVSNPGPKKIESASKEEIKALITEINKFKPDLLFVAFGHVRQERWLVENIENIDTKVGMGVGGAFNYLSGRSQMPPRWVGDIGMEWLWRLVLEPWRWRRQLKLFKFWGLVVKSIVS